MRENRRPLRSTATANTRSQIEAAVDGPGLRPRFEELKRLIGLAADKYGAGDLEGHVQAALASVTLAAELARDIRAHTGLTLDDEPLGKLLVNLANEELLSRLMAGRYKVPAFDVLLPLGRPPGRRSATRRRLIEAVAARPGVSNAEIVRLGREIDPNSWPPEELDDHDSRRKRIARVRRDATK